MSYPGHCFWDWDLPLCRGCYGCILNSMIIHMKENSEKKRWSECIHPYSRSTSGATQLGTCILQCVVFFTWQAESRLHTNPYEWGPMKSNWFNWLKASPGQHWSSLQFKVANLKNRKSSFVGSWIFIFSKVSANLMFPKTCTGFIMA